MRYLLSPRDIAVVASRGPSGGGAALPERVSFGRDGTVVLLHRGSDMVDGAEALEGPDLDAPDVPILLQAGVDQDIDPPVSRLRRHHLVFRQLDDQIRLAHVPGIAVFELARRGHIGGVAFRRSGIHPLDDGRDLIVAE